MEVGIDEPLGQRVPASRIFLRQCYRDLFPVIWKAFQTGKRATVCLTGTPGVGKSMFGLCFLFKLVRFLKASAASDAKPAEFGLGLNGTIVYEHVSNVRDASSPDFYIIDAIANTVHTTSVRPTPLLRDLHTFLMRDGPCANADVSCAVLWISSPRADSFQKGTETLGGEAFVLNPWDANELVECWRRGCAVVENLPNKESSEAVRVTAKEVLDALDDNTDEDEKTEALLRRWVGEFGPVARRVLNPVMAHQRLVGALRDLGGRDIDELAEIATANDPGGETNRFKHSHRLLLMVPSADFSTYHFVPSSVAIGRKILQKQLAGGVQYAQSLMGKLVGAHLGLVFEPFAHHMLAAGNTWRIRSLAAGGAEEEFKLPALKTVDVANGQVEALPLKADEYYVPTDPTYAVVDSWCATDMFQVTVSPSHPIKSGAKQFKALKGKGPCRLIFVVPSGLAPQFVQQPLVDAKGKHCDGGPHGGWNSVPQYVLGL